MARLHTSRQNWRSLSACHAYRKQGRRSARQRQVRGRSRRKKKEKKTGAGQVKNCHTSLPLRQSASIANLASPLQRRGAKKKSSLSSVGLDRKSSSPPPLLFLPPTHRQTVNMLHPSSPCARKSTWRKEKKARERSTGALAFSCLLLAHARAPGGRCRPPASKQACLPLRARRTNHSSSHP